MSVIKLHTYCGNTCSALILDSTRQGRKTIQIDHTLSDLASDMSYAVDCAQDKFTIFADYFEFKAGGPYLTPGSFVEITSSGLTMVSVVTDIGSSEHYNYFSIRGKTEISIGRSNPCTVCYNYGNFISNKPHCKLRYDKDYGTYILENTCGSPSVYVNNSRIDGSIPLYFGDEISILGLSIVFLGAVVAINNPSQMVTTTLQPSRDDIFNVAKPAEESEFARSTRIYKSPVSENFSIDAPISKNQQQKLPIALTVGPAITMGVSVASSMMISLSSAASSGSSPVPGIIMSGTMLVGMFVWPSATRRWQDKKEKEEEALRKKNYMDYINKTKEKIVEKVQYNLNLFNENLTDSNHIAEWIFDEGLSRRIWERSYYDKDFAEVRLGVGKRKNLSQIEIPRAGYLSENDELNQLAVLLKEEFEYIENSPVSIDLKRLNSVGLIGAFSLASQMALNMAFQLAALHDSSELKMVFIYDEKTKKSFEWVKKLPHIWNNDMDFRFIAKDKDEVQTLFRYLSSEFENRLAQENRRNTAPIPAYVLFVINKELIEDVSISKFVTADFDKTGFASVFAFGNINVIPNGCKALVQCAKDKCGIYSNLDNEKGLTTFDKDDLDLNAIYNFATAMTLFKSDTGKSKAGIPTTVTFLDLFKAANIEEINILSKWSESNPQKSLAVPIGIKNGGELFKLDIHEKYHGSHGLMAGTTGSGKSECIQSIILSLAVHFHPDDLSFVLIDFKGGGMANCFTGMPHIAGTITNLGNQIRRSMISLNSELKRRQNMLKEAGVNHIDKYQALFKNGTVELPMPHLVIVSDEFAELKQQQPEFMSELISVARIGRSLGVHLILATQKPSGVVDDQIWSNTRFRICLKVADKSDSTGMVGVPDAAGITVPGRGYVQVGYNEVFELVQTAYTGADYVPVDKFVNKEQQRVSLIDGCGEIVASAEIKATALENTKKQSQLEAVVDYFGKISAENNIKPNLIWQEPLKPILSLSEITLYNEMMGEDLKKGHTVLPVIGIIDDPEIQRQHPLTIDLSSRGHLVLYGMPGSGKTTFLQTLLYSAITTYKAEEVHFTILDFGGRVLELFSSVSHTDRVFFPDDTEKIEQFFIEIMDEIEVRRNAFAHVRQENLPAYCKASGEKLPALVIVIDNFAKFYEQCDAYEESFGTIVREGAKYGITIVTTANTVNALSYKFTDYFVQKYTLQLADPSDYTSVVGATMGMKPEPIKGRGLVRYESRLVEYHTALAFEEVDDGLRSEKILSKISELFPRRSQESSKEKVSKENGNKEKAKEKKSGFSMPGLGFGSSSSSKVTKSPKAKSSDDLKTYLAQGEKSIVIAHNRKTGAEYTLPIKEHAAFYMLHNQVVSEHLFIVNLALKLLQAGLGEIEYFGEKASDQEENFNVYKEETDLTKLVDKMESFNGKQMYVLIDDLMEFYKKVSDADLDRLVKMLTSLNEKNIFIIIAATVEDATILKDYPFGIFLFKECPRGILIGGKAIDATTVLSNTFTDKLSLDTLNYVTGSNIALLFDEKGDSAKVTPTFVN